MSSYVVLARKWRPQRFEDLTGQEHVTRTLCNSIEQGRVPHAMLFTGARGVGKTTSARLLAMSLNCVDGPTTTPCGKCDSCTQIQKSQSVDVLEIDGASNRGINEIRELREGVRYAPSRDRYKIYIIDEVHMLTTEAFNALLKTLEEPPAHVVFMFATTEAQKIPVTILSRCQRFDFRRIPHNEIVARLRHIADAEGLDIDAEVLGIVARQAAGGMRDALSLLDQVIAFSGTTIRLEDAESILGAAERRRLFELSAALISRDVEAALRVVDFVDAFGVDITHFSTELVAHLRDLSIVAVTKDPTGLVMLTDGELVDARQQVTSTDVGTLHRMFEIMVDAGENIARSNHPKLLFEMVLIRLTAIEPAHSLLAIAKRLEALANGNKLPPPTGSGEGGGSTSGGGNPQEETGQGSDAAQVAGNATRPLASLTTASVAPDAAIASAAETVVLVQTPSAEPAELNPTIEPTQTVETTQAAEAIQPVEPTQAAEAIQPVEPAQAAEAVQPVEPTQAAEAIQPVEPTQAAEAVQPVELTQAAEPTQPVEPTQAAEPIQPVEPTQTTETTNAPETVGAVVASPTQDAMAPLSEPESVEAKPKSEKTSAIRALSLSGALDSSTPSPAAREERQAASLPPVTQENRSSTASEELGATLAEIGSLVEVAVPAPSGEPLSSEAWKRTVGALRKEQPHAGELIASAYAVPTESGVMLGLDVALLERVDSSVLGRLNALCAELGGGSHNFSVTTLDSLEGSTSNGYSVVEDERAAVAARQLAAEVYVREHAATSLLMERFPGSKLYNIQIPTAVQEAL